MHIRRTFDPNLTNSRRIPSRDPASCQQSPFPNPTPAHRPRSHSNLPRYCAADVATAAPVTPCLRYRIAAISPTRLATPATAHTLSGVHASCYPKQAPCSTLTTMLAGHARARINKYEYANLSVLGSVLRARSRWGPARTSAAPTTIPVPTAMVKA